MKKNMKHKKPETVGDLALAEVTPDIVCAPNQDMCDAIIANCMKSDGGVLYASVPLVLMDLDRAYQRERKPHYKTIAENWDENKCGVLTVSNRDGRFYIVDGQHRFEAAKIRGVKRLYCLVHTNWTQEDEAWAFAHQDYEKKRVHGAEKLRADCVSKRDEVPLAVRRVCEKHNVVWFQATGRPAGVLTAPERAKAIVRKHGEEMLDDIFVLIDSMDWRMEKGAYSANVLMGASSFLLTVKDRQEAIRRVSRVMKAGVRHRSLREVFEWAHERYPELSRTDALAKLWGHYAFDD